MVRLKSSTKNPSRVRYHAAQVVPTDHMRGAVLACATGTTKQGAVIACVTRVIKKTQHIQIPPRADSERSKSYWSQISSNQYAVERLNSAPKIPSRVRYQAAKLRTHEPFARSNVSVFFAGWHLLRGPPSNQLV